MNFSIVSRKLSKSACIIVGLLLSESLAAIDAIKAENLKIIVAPTAIVTSGDYPWPDRDRISDTIREHLDKYLMNQSYLKYLTNRYGPSSAVSVLIECEKLELSKIETGPNLDFAVQVSVSVGGSLAIKSQIARSTALPESMDLVEGAAAAIESDLALVLREPAVIGVPLRINVLNDQEIIVELPFGSSLNRGSRFYVYDGANDNAPLALGYVAEIQDQACLGRIVWKSGPLSREYVARVVKDQVVENNLKVGMLFSGNTLSGISVSNNLYINLPGIDFDPYIGTTYSFEKLFDSSGQVLKPDLWGVYTGIEAQIPVFLFTFFASVDFGISTPQNYGSSNLTSLTPEYYLRFSGSLGVKCNVDINLVPFLEFSEILDFSEYSSLSPIQAMAVFVGLSVQI